MTDRRDFLLRGGMAALAGAAMPAAAANIQVDPAIVRSNDEAAERYLKAQNLDAKSRWFGGVPDATGLYGAGGASGLATVLTAAFVSEGSKYRGDREVAQRLQHAAAFLERCQGPDGNISLLTTNFNSPPDTGFVVHNVAEAASVARKHGAPEIEKALEPFLRKAGAGMAKGGVHTPNHRWVICAALAQIHDLWPRPEYARRIEQWLAEGIDIDEDGQFSERSTTIYNTVCDRAFTTMALKLKRPALLDPVRRNLEAMLHLRHGDGEVVTEISRRQDLNERGTMDRYWYPLRALAVLDRDGRYASLVRGMEPRVAGLSTLLDHPEIAGALPADAPLPENYEKHFRALELIRIRRGPLSASIFTNGTSRFFTVRRGDAVIEAVRFASAFFGKGQFVPTRWNRAEQNGGYVLSQSLEAGYYQPLAGPVAMGTEVWRQVRPRRQVTELCRLTQSAEIRETKSGFRLRLRAEGTAEVPLAVEIGLREGSKISGAAHTVSDSVSIAGAGALTIERGSSRIRISGCGAPEHQWVQIRGAENPLPGPRLYITGLTPFDRTIDIELG